MWTNVSCCFILFYFLWKLYATSFRLFYMCENDCDTIKRIKYSTTICFNVYFTSRLCDQTIAGGGSGANLTTHVKFIVLSLLIKRSGPPWISVIGSVNYNRIYTFMYSVASFCSVYALTGTQINYSYEWKHFFFKDGVHYKWPPTEWTNGWNTEQIEGKREKLLHTSQNKQKIFFPFVEIN